MRAEKDRECCHTGSAGRDDASGRASSGRADVHLARVASRCGSNVYLSSGTCNGAGCGVYMAKLCLSAEPAAGIIYRIRILPWLWNVWLLFLAVYRTPILPADDEELWIWP